ncbi:C-terminal region of aryl-sulfatase [Planctomycetales bacterium 10988]|nr:C-terminal region of aryl-sulfatase [Planctomycetales bacterium 10988]
MLRRTQRVLVALAVSLPFLIDITSASAEKQPNFIIIFADDLGYGDLGCYGNPTIATPNLDRMAAEGMKFTQFYSAACVCTPSRAALMTGRVPVRSGMYGDKSRVLFPNSLSGLQAKERTIAEGLKSVGYQTACVGKWHLGHLPDYLPTEHGFDYYYGIPYSNDMKPCPLMRNTEVLEEPADQTTLTRRYTEEILSFLDDAKDEPFFLYYAQTFPHVPLFASDDFLGKSRRGLYGDVVEELDWSVGAIFEKLRELKLDKNTLVLFTSDNGPWLIKQQEGGTAGQLKDGKGCTWEGGMREPGLAWWPGKIPAGSVNPELASTLDYLPTLFALAGVATTPDRRLDGVDMSPILLQNGPNNRKGMPFYRGSELMAYRHGPWKVHFFTQAAYGRESRNRVEHDPPLLFNLEHDPSERFNLNEEYPEVLAEVIQAAKEFESTVKIAPSELEKREAK